MSAQAFQPGTLVRARGREWVVLPETQEEVLHLRPLGGGEDDATVIFLPLERKPPGPATFVPPDPAKAGSQAASLLLRDALRLKLRAGAGPFRSFGNLVVEPRAYQLVPLLMSLKLDTVRLLVADDVGVGKTIEAGLIARELLDRGEIGRMTVVCPPHLCEQWKSELATKFNIPTEVVRTGTASRLERGLPADKSIFDAYPFTVVSLDYIKSDRRRDEFLNRCPEFVIVEEAHTCVQGSGASRHQRYQLLKGLASDTERHMVLLTATPHSGDEEAFYNLLGLLNVRYQQIRDAAGEQRDSLRQQLAMHFVQRRRPDIAEWKDATVFPDRQTKEATYALTGEWGQLFEEVLAYARGMVKRAEGKGLLLQRMSWWAALALLRCVSSSPAAATNALRTRLTAVEGVPEDEQSLIVAAPDPGGDIDVETMDGLLLAPPPTEIDPPDRGRRPIMNAEDILVAIRKDDLGHLQGAGFPRVLERRLRLVTLPVALFLVRGDPHGAPRADMLDAIERRQVRPAFEPDVASHAALRIVLVPEMPVTAVGADARRARRQLGLRRDAFLVAHPEDRLAYPVLTALVIDDRLWPEFGKP